MVLIVFAQYGGFHPSIERACDGGGNSIRCLLCKWAALPIVIWRGGPVSMVGIPLPLVGSLSCLLALMRSALCPSFLRNCAMIRLVCALALQRQRGFLMHGAHRANGPLMRLARLRRCVCLNPDPNPKKIHDLCARFEAMFPHIGTVRLKSAWAGMIDTMPDIIPVMDRVAALPGLTLGTGFSGHGFGIGPGAGRILAALATGEDVGHDLTRFRLSRFSDGSKMRLGPAI